MQAESRAAASGNVLRLFKSRGAALGMTACGAFFMGQFALFTYVRPFLEGVTHVSMSALSLVLLTIGVAGFIGTTLIGHVPEAGGVPHPDLHPTVDGGYRLGADPLWRLVAAVAALLGLWGLAATAAPVGWWSWIARTMPKNAEAVGGSMVAVIQLAIALGSTLGGLLFDISGYQTTFVASAALLLVAAFLTFLASRSGMAQAA
ncbi:major facilitator superfamily MFS_1 [Cupriavidus necator N-1]|uniref:Major facilitator superfamily MFS_1 n=1 Tax=Cupriavidus necator (strain ATCC 43291 / DSM 13513 / CCUG 52238 / LMG 8453 / N-1) TaxID=1042878 RepID=F8GPM4_CUPNN|nr:major facilitator superfamily MFS_1 [Cupriavidus necator N-1]